jgi:MFS family permease
MALLQFSAQIAGGITALILGDVAAIFIAVAVVNVLCAAITLSMVREDPVVAESPPASFAEAWVAPWRHPDFRWAWFTRFLNALGFYLIITYLSYYLVDAVKVYEVFGVSVAKAGGDVSPEDAAQKAVFVLALLISLMAAVGGVVGGRMSDRVGRKRVIYVAGTAMAVLLPPFALFPNFTLIAMLAIGFGLAYGAYESSGWALVSDVMPSKSDLAKDMGLWQSSISAPQILSGLAGMAVDWGNRIESGRGYVFTFLFAALAYLVSTVLVRKIRGST